MSVEDPVARRMRELSEKSKMGLCSPAELEELALYGVETSLERGPSRAVVAQASHEDQWIERAARDEALSTEQRINAQRPVRKIGVGLTVAGVIILFVPAAQIIGLTALMTGAFMLAGSVLLERATQANRDPYDDVDQ